jgi:hypothetical protein
LTKRTPGKGGIILIVIVIVILDKLGVPRPLFVPTKHDPPVSAIKK